MASFSFQGLSLILPLVSLISGSHLQREGPNHGLLECSSYLSTHTPSCSLLLPNFPVHSALSGPQLAVDLSLFPPLMLEPAFWNALPRTLSFLGFTLLSCLLPAEIQPPFLTWYLCLSLKLVKGKAFIFAPEQRHFQIQSTHRKTK